MKLRLIGKQDKKGFLRIFEAFIAIMIIAGVMGFLYFQKFKGPDKEDIILEQIQLALKEIQNNAELRETVLANTGEYNGEGCEEIEGDDLKFLCNKIRDIIPKRQYEFKFKICLLNDVCKLSEYMEREVYSDEVSVSSTLTDFGPQKIRIFVWEREGE